MRVVLEAQHICTPEPRGIPVYVIQLIKCLLKRNQFDYSLTLFDKDKERNNYKYIAKYFGDYNVPVYECNKESYKTLMQGDEIYRNKSYNDITGAHGDVFHFPHLTPIPTKLDGKIVVTIHDVLPIIRPEFFSENLNAGFSFWWKKILEMNATIITDSESTKNDIIRISNHKDVHVVPLGYNDEMYYCDKDTSVLDKFNINSPYIFYCGGIDMRKNIIRIIYAFDEVVKKEPNVKLVLAGAPYTNSAPIMEMLEERKSAGKIIYLGYVSDEEKRALMSQAELFAFPAIYEGFGLPILEAMACGCPVISSNVSSMPEVAGDAGILINPENTDELANGILKLIKSDDLRNEYRNKGYIRVKNYTWDKTAELTENVYRKVYSE